MWSHPFSAVSTTFSSLFSVPCTARWTVRLLLCLHVPNVHLHEKQKMRRRAHSTTTTRNTFMFAKKNLSLLFLLSFFVAHELEAINSDRLQNWSTSSTAWVVQTYKISPRSVPISPSYDPNKFALGLLKENACKKSHFSKEHFSAVSTNISVFSSIPARTQWELAVYT